MSTYGILKSSVRNAVNKTNLDGEISASVQMAIQFYENTRFYFNEQRATLNTTAGGEFYAQPLDFLFSDSLVLSAQSSRYQLVRKPYSWFEEFQTSSPPFRGTPEYYSEYQTQFRLYPVPDASNTMYLSYVKQLSALSADGDSNAWTTDAFDMILGRSGWRVMLLFMRDTEKASMFQALEQSEYARLNTLSVQRQMSGKIRRGDWPL